MWVLIKKGPFGEETWETFDSHRKAKNALHWAIVEAQKDMLDMQFEIKKLN